MPSQPDFSFSDITEVYLQELRRGNSVPIKLLAKRFPQYADRILGELPTIALIEGSLSQAENSNSEGLEIPGLTLIKEIGRGSSGVVYMGRELHSGIKVAVKVVQLNSIAQDLLRLDREIESLSRLNHPNIVSIRSHGAIQDYVYIVMNYVDGCSLAEIMEPNPGILASFWQGELRSDWSRLAAWALEVVDALDYVHRQKIFHRDLKPANILIDREGKCWITDFGLAKVRDAGLTVSRSGMVVGTPRFMAPEQMRGLADRRSDIFSLGRTLYELASLAAEDKTKIEQSVDLPPICDINPAISSELGKIINKACQQVAERRFQSAREMSAVLERYLQGKVPCDRRRPGKRMSEKQFKAAMRRRYQLATAGAATVFGATLTGLVGWQQWERFIQNKNKQAAAQIDPVVATSFQNLAAKIENSQVGFVEVIGEAIKHSVNQNKDRESAAEIEQKIDKIVHQVSTQGLKPGELDGIIHNYRSSALSVSDKIIALIGPLRVSGLTDQDKMRGEQILMLFAKSVVNKRVSTVEGERVLAALFQGHIPKLDEIVAMQIPERPLVAWLQLVENTFGQHFAAVANEPLLVQEELNEILDQYMQAIQ